MTTSTAVPSVFDVQSLSALKKGAKDADPKALKAAAQQFEALFLQMVLKSMRDATPHEGMFDSDQTRLYESLLDQQLSQVLTTRGGTGLAAVIEKQLARAVDGEHEALGALPLTAKPPLPFVLERGVAPVLPLRPPDSGRGIPLDGAVGAPKMPRIEPTARPADAMPAPQALSGETVPAGARDFVARVWPHAQEVSRTTGIPAHFMVAQAALETGWGKSEPRAADGRGSNNLFGIKAGRSWGGHVVEAQTSEYVNGVAQRQTEQFRAYPSVADSFRDYASLLMSSPRYAGLRGTQDPAAFARGLQHAGYATDPLYAAKLERIISGPTLRQALAG